MRRDFNNWVLFESVASNIQIDLSHYENQIREAIDRVEEFSKDKSHELEHNFQFDPEIIRRLSPFYPRTDALISVLSGNDYKAIDKEVDVFVDKFIKTMQGNDITADDKIDLRKAYQHVLDQADILKGDYRYDPAEYEQWYNQLIQQTNQNMQSLKAKIAIAVNGIPNWNHSPIRLEASAHYTLSMNDIALEPAEDAAVYVGSDAYFSLFQNEGQFIIDDIIEGGFDEEEFFANDLVKSDYYALINELRNPGSSKQGKILTLYTARPISDRSFFMHNKYLPINLFLTNSASHADGLAQDLGGERELWKVKIDSKYLTQTLDGSVKYYMVTTDRAPVLSMELY